MANVLDLRRRIRSVKNTRQITKAMKMVSAATLRRAQERAISARPYAQMMVSILESLVTVPKFTIPSPASAVTRCSMTRPEKNVLLDRRSPATRASRVHSTQTSSKSATEFLLDAPATWGLDIEAIGRKGRDLVRQTFPRGHLCELSADDTRRRMMTALRCATGKLISRSRATIPECSRTSTSRA